MSAPAPLLTTKLRILPARPASRRVARPRLTARLNEGLARPLTLISAPAGFGKTTLLSEWWEDAGRDFALAWLSLDDDDSEPIRFLTYLVAAASLKPGTGDTALVLFQSPQPPPSRTILTTLINDLSAISGPCALALDDYHVITAQAVHEALTFLLEHLPLQMHFCILAHGPAAAARPVARRQPARRDSRGRSALHTRRSESFSQSGHGIEPVGREY